jgi:hypothetical protein
MRKSPCPDLRGASEGNDRGLLYNWTFRAELADQGEAGVAGSVRAHNRGGQRFVPRVPGTPRVARA